MRYSIQQIKYDFLYAIKEYDSDGTRWQVTLSEFPPAETLQRSGLDPDEYVFLGKPAGTPRAAELVRDFFMQRYAVSELKGADQDSLRAEWVILFRAKTSLPRPVDPLSA